MADISIPWKKITRGLPHAIQSANDRAPTLEEIIQLLKYPDRRIKPIRYTMVSSGIRYDNDEKVIKQYDDQIK